MNVPVTAFAEDNIQDSEAVESIELTTDDSNVAEEAAGTDGSNEITDNTATVESADSGISNSGSKMTSEAEDISDETSNTDGELAVEADNTGLVLQNGDILKSSTITNGPRRAPVATSTSIVYDGAAETVISAIRNRQSEVDITSYSIPTSNISALTKRIYNTSGDLFYFNKYSYYSSDNKVTRLLLTYKTDYSNADIQSFYDKVDEVLGQLDSSWSDIEKILYIHDYLVTNINYDFSYSKSNSYNALMEHSSVCQGYALIFDYFMERLNIPCEVISSSDLNHAWNEITLNGENFYVDCTWDDPTGCIEEYCKHNNFLVDQDKLYNNKHEATDWVNSKSETVYGTSSSDKYNDYFWQSTNTLIPQIGRKCAYIRKSGSSYYISQYDFSNATTTDLCTLSDRWPVFNKDGYSWTNTYTQLRRIGQEYLYTTPTNINTLSQSGENASAYELSDEEKSKGNIIGITVTDETAGNVKYNVYDSPNASSSSEHIIVADATGTFSINAEVPLEITTQPEDAEGVIGDTVEFTVSATGAKSYRWYSSSDGNIWNMIGSDSNIPGYNESIMKLPLNAGRIKLQYHVVVIGNNGKTVTSNAVKIINDAVSITSQPKDATGTIGDTVQFSVTAANANGYQWYSSPDGTTWNMIGSGSNIPGYNAATMKLPLNAGRLKLQYHVVVTGNNGRMVTSDAVKVINNELAITSQPEDAVGTVGDTVEFSVTATGAKSYQWYSSPDGKTWNMIGSGSNIPGYNAATMKLPVNAGRAKLQYHVVVTGTDGKTVSSNTVKVVAGVKITSQPVDAAGIAGDIVSFTVVANGAKSYQWYSSPDGKTWNRINSVSNIPGYNAATMKLSVNASRAELQYHVVITGNDGSTVTSNAVKVLANATITSQPVDATGKAGDTVTFKVTATGAKSYQWYSSPDGKVWNRINSVSNIPGYNAATMKLPVTESRAKLQYHVVVTGADGEQVTSNAVKVLPATS